MFDLTKQEKIILLFLTASFITGLGIGAYKKSQSRLKLDIQPYQMAALEDADDFIAQHSQVNINSLNADELTRLPGVGEKLAARIVAYHKLHGAFRAKEELLQVKGIGEKKFEQLKDLIILE